MLVGGNRKLIERDVQAAQKAAQSCAESGGENMFVQWHDVRVPGLVLRLRGKRLTWIVKHRGSSLVIGTAYPPDDRRKLTGPNDARELAGKVKEIVDQDKFQVGPYLAAYYGAGRNHDTAVDVMKPKAETWSFDECIYQTIKDKTNSKTREKDRIGNATVKDYHTTFNRPCWDELKSKPAVLLTAEDIERVHEFIAENFGTSPAIKAITYTRSVLNWCAKYRKSGSGLGDVKPWWQMLSSPYEVQPKKRMPTIVEIARTMVLAEHYLDKPLPGRAINAAGVKSGTLAGLWWIVLTAQRADAGLSILAHDIVLDPHDENYVLAVWSEDIMKAGQAHVLPIPRRAWEFINAFREKNRHYGTHEWAFPSEKDGRKHATPSGVYRIVYRLAGRDIVEQKKKDVGREPRLRKDGQPFRKLERTSRHNLLADSLIAWWSMHDGRRSLTDFLGTQGIPGGATVVLAHDINEKENLAVTASDREREDFLRLRTARVTRMAYGGAQYLSLKKEALMLWTSALLDEHARQKAAFEKSGAFLPAYETHPMTESA